MDEKDNWTLNPRRDCWLTLPEDSRGYSGCSQPCVIIVSICCSDVKSFFAVMNHHRDVNEKNWNYFVVPCINYVAPPDLCSSLCCDVCYRCHVACLQGHKTQKLQLQNIPFWFLIERRFYITVKLLHCNWKNTLTLPSFFTSFMFL